MKARILTVFVFGIFLSACVTPNQMAHEYKEIVKDKISQYAIENIQSDLSDDAYLEALWRVIKEDALKYYQVGYPDKNPEYHHTEMKKYKARLRKEISQLREELRRHLTA